MASKNKEMDGSKKNLLSKEAEMICWQEKGNNIFPEDSLLKENER